MYAGNSGTDCRILADVWASRRSSTGGAGTNSRRPGVWDIAFFPRGGSSNRIRRGERVAKFNEAYLNLNQSYLFAEIRRRTKAFTDAHPDVRVIDLGVGDVTQSLPPAVVRAIHDAADDMARRETFKGYGPYVGYEFLRAEIATHDFGSRGVKIAVDEVFVSDGGKSDSA